MVDYLRLAQQLREKANYVPPEGSGLASVPPDEKAALLAKAEEFEAKWRNGNSRSTNDTTTTSRDGFIWWTDEALFQRIREQRQATAQRVAEDLLKNQWRWNREYYDQDGKPRPQTPDPADLVEEGYQTDPDDEDYGYDIFEGDYTNDK